VSDEHGLEGAERYQARGERMPDRRLDASGVDCAEIAQGAQDVRAADVRSPLRGREVSKIGRSVDADPFAAPRARPVEHDQVDGIVVGPGRAPQKCCRSMGCQRA